MSDGDPIDYTTNPRPFRAPFDHDQGWRDCSHSRLREPESILHKNMRELRERLGDDELLKRSGLGPGVDPLLCRFTVHDRDGNLVGTGTGHSLQETGLICPDGGTLTTVIVAYE